MNADLVQSAGRREGRSGLLRALGGSRRELFLGGAVAVVSMIFIAAFARDFWFRYDNFLLVANRRIGSLDDWFRPHKEHWLTWTVLLSRALRGLVGMHYWPWWYFPRLFGHAFVAFLIWRTLLHRGADRVIAFGTYLVLLVLAVSYFLDALTMANYVLFPCVVVVALLVSEVDAPRPRHLAVVGTGLLAAVMANGYGIALLLAVAVVVTARHRFRRWMPAVVPPAVIVGAWYLRYRSQLPHHKHSLSLHFDYETIRSSFVVVRTAIENTFGLPSALAVLVVGAIAGLLVWLMYRHRLDIFDAIIAVTLVIVLGILAWARTTHQLGAPRYGYAVVLLLTLVVVPRLRLPANPVAITAVATVLVAVVAFNAVSLSRRLEETGRVSKSIRALAETTGALIAAGEPYSYQVFSRSGIEPGVIERLVDGGWHPTRSADPAVVKSARELMRGVTVGDRSTRAFNAKSDVGPAAAGVDDDGCLVLTGTSVVDLQVTAAGSFTVNRPVAVIWTDLRGTDTRVVVDPGKIGVAAPVANATMKVRTFGEGRTRICSLTPVGLPEP